MTTAAMTAYAYDQIDQARTELNAVSKWTTYERLESQSQSCATGSALRFTVDLRMHADHW